MNEFSDLRPRPGRHPHASGIFGVRRRKHVGHWCKRGDVIVEQRRRGESHPHPEDPPDWKLNEGAKFGPLVIFIRIFSSNIIILPEDCMKFPRSHKL